MSAPVGSVSKFTSMAVGPVPHPNATGKQIAANTWIACEFPERPPDEWVMYHVMPECHACNVAKIAAARVLGELPDARRAR